MAEDRNIPGVAVNIAEYIEGKAAGATKIVKMNGATYYSQKQFDSNTGAPKPLLIAIDQKSIEEIKANLEKDLRNLDMLLADMKTAQEIMP